jgi:hypothetical protein
MVEALAPGADVAVVVNAVGRDVPEIFLNTRRHM